jgi:hypothetical protein
MEWNEFPRDLASIADLHASAVVNKGAVGQVSMSLRQV